MPKIIPCSLAVLLMATAAQAQAPTIQITVDDVVRPAASFAGEGFGAGVDADGIRFVASASGDDLSTDPGRWSRAEVWRRQADGSWIQDLAGVLTPTYSRSENDDFGQDVAISGDTVIVGAPAYSFTPLNAGRAVVYQRGTSIPFFGWSAKKQLDGDSSLGGFFGQAVDIDSDTAVVCGANYAKVFERDQGGAENWGETATLEDPSSISFCSAVAIDGDWIAVGNELFDSVTASKSGLVYVYRRSSGPNAWQLVTSLGPAVPTANLRLGLSVGIIHGADQTILVAAGTLSAGVTIWKRPLASGFTVDGTLTEPTIVSFGRHLDMDGRSLLLSGESSHISQRVLLYRREAGTWRLGATFLSYGLNNAQDYGSSLGLSGGLMVAGSPMGDVLTSNSNDGWVSLLSDGIFVDGFESGDLTAWSASFP